MTGNRVKWMLRDKRTRRTMEQIVAEGMADDTNRLNDALEGLIAAQGGAISLPTEFNWSYDNRTAGAGTEPETNYTIYDYTIVGGLVYIGESGKEVSSLGFRVITGAVGATARVSLYAASGNVTEAPLAGTRIVDAGTVSVATPGVKSIALGASMPAVDPGFYWIMVEPSAEITIAGFASFAGYLGQNETTGAVYSGMSVNISGDPLDPHPSLLDGGSREPIAPLVLFRISDVD
jgi:hypothetical protein